MRPRVDAPLTLLIWLRTGDVIEQACPRHALTRTTRRLMSRGCYTRVTESDGRARESLVRVDRIEWGG
jgi:hypothetical protein